MVRRFIVGFSKAVSWYAIGSRIIQLVECRNFSHAYILFIDEITDVEMVAQASHGYVNLVNYSIFCKHNVIVEEYEIECTDVEFKEIQKFINMNLGKPYSKLQLFWIGIKKLFNVELRIKEDKDSGFICSEWTSRICQIAGIEVVCDQDYITPSDLHEIIIKLGIAKRLE